MRGISLNGCLVSISHKTDGAISLNVKLDHTNSNQIKIIARKGNNATQHEKINDWYNESRRHECLVSYLCIDTPANYVLIFALRLQAWYSQLAKPPRSLKTLLRWGYPSAPACTSKPRTSPRLMTFVILQRRGPGRKSWTIANVHTKLSSWVIW